jgi:hypothetical protein
MENYYAGRINTPDSVAPDVYLIGKTEVTVKQYDTYFDSGARAVDDIDGDIPR